MMEDGLTEVFRSRDPIERLRIKVTLQEVTAGPTVNVDVDGDGIGDGDPSVALVPTVAETRTIAWQEKVFSKDEVERYRDAEACVTEQEKQYHDEVTRLLTARASPGRISTYVDEDNYDSRHEERLPVTVNGHCSVSVLQQKMNALRRRKGHRAEPTVLGPSPALNDVIVSHPTEADKAKRLVDTPFQVMYIMADLSPPRGVGTAHDEGNGKDSGVRDGMQHVLCVIRVDDNGVITMSPSFNNDRPRYRINEGGTVWEYELVHMSRDITPKEAADEALVLQEMYQRHAELCANRVGTSFRTLPDDLCNDTVWHVFGEVVSAHHFEYNNLYTRLQLDLPPGWILDATSARAFVTQVSRTSSTGDSDNTAMFSYPFELAVRSPAQQDDGTGSSEDASTRSPSLSPKLIVQVNSLDELERHRPEGYGYTLIPLFPGAHVACVETWRPVGPHIVGKMRRYFLGGAPELHDPTYAAIPHDHTDVVLNKHGFRTEASGTVRIRMHVVKQTHPDRAGAARLASEAERRPRHVKLASVARTTLDVLAQFKRAHARMLEQSDV